LRENKVRCITDFRNEKLNYKLRELSLQKINFIAIIGDREFKNKNVVLRTLGSKEQEVHSLDEFIKKIKNSCRID
jgi:threonyl-tRNA synthetase